MRIAILGGAGFMGSNFVRYLVNSYSDIEVLVYDKLTNAGRLENLHEVINRIKFARSNICNEEFLEHVFRELRLDIVMNFAAETHVDRFINEPTPFLRTNVFGTFTVLEVIRKLDIPRHIYVSTDEVYSDLHGIEGEASETWSLSPL